ncbi:hypothetical protein D9M73_244890 [compost metagenome]
MALFDGDAQLHALDQPLQALGIIALRSADQAFGDHAVLVGEGQHDAAIQVLDAQVDPVLRLEGIVDQLERVVHAAYLTQVRHAFIDRLWRPIVSPPRPVTGCQSSKSKTRAGHLTVRRA